MVGPILIILLFIVLGIIFSMGKGSFLIVGYNTATKEEQDKYDKVKLCRFMGKFMFFFAFCITLFSLSGGI